MILPKIKIYTHNIIQISKCKSGVEAGKSSKTLLQSTQLNNQFTWQLVTGLAVTLPQLPRCIIYF